MHTKMQVVDIRGVDECEVHFNGFRLVLSKLINGDDLVLELVRPKSSDKSNMIFIDPIELEPY